LRDSGICFLTSITFPVQATGTMPDSATVRALLHIAWSASAAALQLAHAPHEQIHRAVEQLHGPVSSGDGDQVSPDADDVSVCREALEVLAICLALCPDATEILYKERTWQSFIIDILLLCRNRLVSNES
jgi:ubiquitin carboxyl-terminal hydrolase 9/24